eukprot:7388948-Pyramimonas_sp.AAC.1
MHTSPLERNAPPSRRCFWATDCRGRDGARQVPEGVRRRADYSPGSLRQLVLVFARHDLPALHCAGPC